MMQKGELGPVSVVLHSYRESCSKCGTHLSTQENPSEHTCIKEGVGHEQLDSFVFHCVDFIDVAAYPQAGLLEFSAKSLIVSVPLDPVPAIIDTIAEFYASGLYLARNNLAEGQTQHPNVVQAEKKLAEYRASLRRSYKLFSNVDER